MRRLAFLESEHIEGGSGDSHFDFASSEMECTFQLTAKRS